MCLKQYNAFDDIIRIILRKYHKYIDVISCNTYRNTPQLKLNYTVDYVMEKNNKPYLINNIKYAMRVKWKNTGNYAIIIGQNPALSKTSKGNTYNVDDTNWNIIKILHQNGYAGYIMLNTFPEIDPNGKAYTGRNISDFQQCLNIKISKLIFKHLRNIKVILACTTTNRISPQYYDCIISKYQMHCVQQPKVTHFASRALSKLCIYKNIKISEVSPVFDLNTGTIEF